MQDITQTASQIKDYFDMTGLAYHEREFQAAFSPAAGGSDNFDDLPETQEWCSDCYNEGYSRGFTNGAASVRKAPLIAIDWSTLSSGLINILTVIAALSVAYLVGFSQAENRHAIKNVSVSPAVDPEFSIRGGTGTIVVTEGKADKL